MDNDGRVPTLLLRGGSRADRDAAIAQLAAPVPGGHPVAVLRTGAGMLAGPAAALGSHVVVKWAPIACLCCVGGVVFRTSLFGLLHASRPARLVVDLGAGEHVAAFEAELEGQSLLRILKLVGRVDLDASRRIRELGWPADPPSQ